MHASARAFGLPLDGGPLRGHEEPVEPLHLRGPAVVRDNLFHRPTIVNSVAKVVAEM